MENHGLREEELDEIERRANGATSGPWFIRILTDEYTNCMTAVTTRPSTHAELDNPPQYFDPTEVIAVTYVDHPAYATREPVESDANASFVAHARIDVPVLITEVRRLRSLLQLT